MYARVSFFFLNKKTNKDKNKNQKAINPKTK